MRFSGGFLILSLSFLALVVMAIAGNIPYWAWFLPIATGIFSTLIVFRGSYVPQVAATRGMELIQAQDYNNRLVKVGEPNGDKIVTLFNSLIDKLRAERLQNREQESLLSLLIEASPMGVIMLDFNKRVSLVNKAALKILGMKNLEELKGEPFDSLPGDLIPEILKVSLGKSDIIRKSYFRIYRVYHLNFLQEGFKREFFLLESLTDEIMKAEKTAYEKVIRTISHEVNNTLGGLRSVLEILSETNDDPELRMVLESCDSRCEAMGNFIREYAEVVKLPEPVFKTIDLNREIHLVFPFLRRLVPDDVELDLKTHTEKALVKADPGLLQQVIINIVKNAAESLREASVQKKGFVKLEINRGENNNNVVLTISNNGKAIDENTSTQLFTPFFTTKPSGKGIGLTLIREVLSSHSAEYSLFTDSRALTHFIIKFPPK